MVEDLRSSTQEKRLASGVRDPGVAEMNLALLPRGTVTFLFSDIEGSSDLLRRVGDDCSRSSEGIIVAFCARPSRHTAGGRSTRLVMGSSSRSIALGARAAAVSAQHTLATFGWPTDTELRVRMGLHTAEPFVGKEGYVGLGVHRAARICDAAHGGQILVSNATAGIIEDAELPGLELVDIGTHASRASPVSSVCSR